MNICKRIIATLVLFGALSFNNASGEIIDFSDLQQSNGSVFSGPYIEDGFSVTATGGEVFEGHLFGNPAPSLVVGNTFSGGSFGSIGITSGSGAFTFDSFDLAANNGSAEYVVTGLLEGTTMFTLSGSVAGNFGPFSFTTISSGYSGLIDSLGFALTSNGTSLNIDNVVATSAVPVPEPEIYAMLGVGLGFMGWVARRRKRLAA